MGQNILVPVDDSECSKTGLKYAIENFPDADITALHAMEGGGGDLIGMGSGGAEIPDEEMVEDHAERILTAASSLAEEEGKDIDTVEIRGRPDRAIVKHAKDADYDLVVMGSHGRDSAARVLLGSVAEKVVRRAPIPVLIVR